MISIQTVKNAVGANGGIREAPAPDPLCPLRGDSVAIVGFSETSRGEAPWGDAESWPELWLCNRGVCQPWATRWSRHFDPHLLSWTETNFTPDLFREYVEFLSRDHGDRLIYLPAREVAIPNSVAIPVGHLVAFIGRRYLTNAISYQIALALLLGAKRIGLWGIDLRSDTEYGFEKPAIEYLLGLAQGKGVEIVLPDRCSLLNHDGSQPLYGIEEGSTELGEVERMLMNRAREIEALSAKLQAENDRIVRELHLGEGARVQTEIYLQAIRQYRRGGKLLGAEVKP